MIAPANIAVVPAVVIPPLVPGATRRQFHAERGVPPTQVPISVAKVSAAEAASAPAATARQIGLGWMRAPAAAIENTEPLTRTWPASRGPPLATTEEVRRAFRSAPKRETRLEVAK
jgi:hypothetical protein